jgi:Type II secretion system (T2SS), protein K
MLAARSSPHSAARPGYVLVVILLVIVVLSLTAYRFADAMSSELQVAARNSEAAQAKTFAISGIHYTMGLLADPNSLANVLNNNPFDNPDALANVTITTEGPRGGGRFSIVSVVEGGSTDSSRYSVKNGVIDESGKINLNTMMRIDSSGEVLRSMLILLPNMTEDVADAIVDWLDADDDQRTNGAEAGAYTSYRPRNGPINSLDELLYIRGVTVANLYGNDVNRNGVLDAGEDTSTELNRGWADYLTVYGHELNVDATGQPRLYVNNANMSQINQQLAAIVGQELADYAVAYRIYTQSAATNTLSPNTVVGDAAQLRTAVQNSLNTNATARRQIRNSLLSLQGTQVTLPRAPGSPPNTPTVIVKCPLNDPANLKAILPTLMDKVTAKSNHELNPRINVSTCSPTLLSVLPGVTADDVANAVAARANLDPTSAEFKTGAWLHTQAGMRIEIFKNIETYLTGATLTYRIQSIGYFARGGPVARVEAVVDLTDGHPRILHYRDLSELGGGFTPPRN